MIDSVFKICPWLEIGLFVKIADGLEMQIGRITEEVTKIPADGTVYFLCKHPKKRNYRFCFIDEKHITKEAIICCKLRDNN